MSQDLPELRRRSVLAAVAAGGVLLGAGCDASLPGAGDASSPDGTATTDSHTDDRALTESRAAIASTLAAVEAASRRFPELERRYAELIALHQTHLDALDTEPGSSTPDPSASASTTATPASPTTAIAGVRDAERRLVTVLTGHAQRADSGALARLLASMIAALEQIGANA